MASVGLVTFDTLAFVKKMAASGMPGEQAEALAAAQAEIITNSLATKDDLALYYQQGEAKFNELDAKVDTKFNELDAKIDTKFNEINARVNTLDAKVDTKFNELDAKVNILDVKIEALNEKIVAQGEALNEKIVAQGEALNDKIETQGKMLQHDIVIKLGGLMVVLFGLFFALLRAFPLAV